MPTRKLTEFTLAHAKAPAAGRIELWDALLPGFGLRITDKGNKSWILMYRLGGRTAPKRRLTLGTYPGVSLAEARDLARAALALVERGTDPALARKVVIVPARQPDTVENVIAEFMQRFMVGRERSPRYIAETKRNFDNHVLPCWRGRDIASITRRDILDLLDALVDAGKPVAANRTLAAVRKLFNWCSQRGLVEATPAAMIEAPGEETSRDRVLSDAEIRVLWEGLAALGYPFGPFLAMCLATGQRRSEVAAMRHEDVDPARGLWTIPGALTKSGRVHVVPLSALAIDLLKPLPRLGTYVFTSRKDRPVSGFSKAKDAIDVHVASILAAQAAAEAPPPRAALCPSGTGDLQDGGGMIISAEKRGQFSARDLYRIIGIRHDTLVWGYARVTEVLSGEAVRARVLAPFSCAERSTVWVLGPEPWTIHDLRRTMSTNLGRLGVSRFIIGRVLNHADQTVTGIYDRYEYLDEKRHALALWAEQLNRIRRSASANVVMALAL